MVHGGRQVVESVAGSRRLPWEPRAALAGSLAGLVLVLAAGCSPGAAEGIAWGDLSPPSVVDERRDAEGLIELEFDEDVELAPESLRVTGEARPDVVAAKGRTLAIDTAPGSKPGKEYALALSARDGSGNATSMVLPFWGPNPRLPAVRINEVATKVSTTIRDAVELKVLEAGNLEGLTLCLGYPDNFDGMYVFGSVEVAAGDLVVVHCKAEGLAVELDEGADRAASGGKNALPGALDVWMKDAPGLPDSSGVVTLLANPMGGVVDAVFWSDKVTEEGKDYDSFGTKKLLERVRWLEREGAWKGEGETLRPEDGAPGAGLTATRTLCRAADADSDRRADWRVAASGKASLGQENTTVWYE